MTEGHRKITTQVIMGNQMSNINWLFFAMTDNFISGVIAAEDQLFGPSKMASKLTTLLFVVSNVSNS